MSFQPSSDLMPPSRKELDLLTAVLAVRLELLSAGEAAGLLGFRAAAPEGSLTRLGVERGLIDHDEARRLETALARRLTRCAGDLRALTASLMNAECRGLVALVLERTMRDPAPTDETVIGPDEIAALIETHADGRPPADPDPTGADPDADLDLAKTMVEGDSKPDAGAFEVLRPLAQGGLGELFVARDRGLNREVAIKRIRQVFAADSRTLARFLLEAEITGGLEHPGIVPVYAMGWDDAGRPYYAMRLIQGETLKERILTYHQHKREGRSDRRLEFRQLLNHFTRICEVTAYAHGRGVLHRDLKPSNVMIGRYGETLVLDWGLAKSMAGDLDPPGSPGLEERRLEPISGSGTQPTLHGSAIGTPQYMSPEQARGALDQVGPASDVYSLGATLYHILTGRAPLARLSDVGEVLVRVGRGDIERPRSISRRAPRVLESICVKAMSVRPEDRHGSAAELAADVERYLADLPVSGVRESLSDRLGR